MPLSCGLTRLDEQGARAVIAKPAPGRWTNLISRLSHVSPRPLHELHSTMASPAAATTPPTLPTKRIVSKAHLDVWLSSATHSDVVAFVEELNESVVGVKLTDDLPSSPVRPRPSHPRPSSSPSPLTKAAPPLCRSQAVDALVSVLEAVEQLYHDTPPVDNGGSRFGNPAFRDFYDKVASVRPFSPSVSLPLPREGRS